MVIMKERISKLSFVTDKGHKTSVTLGWRFDAAVREVAASRGMWWSHLLRELYDEWDRSMCFSTYVRGWLLEYYRERTVAVRGAAAAELRDGRLLVDQ
jgi:predicted DNA-binding ribbon-helix-helix protein